MEEYSLEIAPLTEISVSEYDICDNLELPEQCEICYKPQDGKLLNILTAEFGSKPVYEILDYFPNIKAYRLIEESLNLCLDCTRQLVLSYLFLVKLEESNKKFKGLIKFSAKAVRTQHTKQNREVKERQLLVENRITDCKDPNKSKTESNTKIELESKDKESKLASNNLININNDHAYIAEPLQVLGTSTHLEPDEPDKGNVVEELRIIVNDSNGFQENKYICDQCNMVFIKKQNLEKHIQRIHLQEKSFQCPTCRKLFFLEQDYSRHILLHTEKTQYKCTLCSKGFVTAGLLKSHVKMVHKKKELSCTSCFKMFKLPIQLKRHIKVHTLVSKEESNEVKLSKAKCNVCGKYFNKYFLKTHMERHSETKKHKCDICEQEFFQLVSLNKHMIRHQEPKFHCGYCSDLFFSKQEMTTHVRRHHTREIVCTCQHCGKGFVHNSNLVQHIRNCHPDDSNGKLVEPKVPRQCSDCGKIYSSRTSLFHHRKRTHENKQYPCTKCDMMFRNLGPLKSHLKKVHNIGETHICNLCDKPFSTKEDLYKHNKRTHSIGTKSLYLGCTLCKTKFKIKHELIQHILGEHLKERDASEMPVLYECNFCVTFFLDLNVFRSHLLEHPIKYVDKIITTEYINGGCRIQSFSQHRKYKQSEDKTLKTD